VVAEIVGQTERETKLKVRGTVDGRTIVSARLVLERYNIGETCPDQASTDEVVRQEMRSLFALLYRPKGQGVPLSAEESGGSSPHSQ